MHAYAFRLRRGLPALVALAFLLLPGAGAEAQVDPFWDHYKVYLAQPHLQISVPVVLADQFMSTTHVAQQLDWFANPVEKRHDPNVFPIRRPDLHYAWWTIGPDMPFTKDLIANNQFGEQLLRVGPPRYLLNPANKNRPPDAPLPAGNHYKCYDCFGQPVNVPVFLTDQFFGRPAQVLFPRFFCNPVEKRTPDGLIHPILDPDQHYTVYEIDPTPPAWSATFADQFVQFASLQLTQDRFLMVPTEKIIPTPAGASTWGRVKSHYR